MTPGEERAAGLLERVRGHPRRECRDVRNPNMFFPLDESKPNQAYALCWAPCPVRTDCLEAAMAQGVSHQWGIWGGYPSKRRREIIRKRLER